MRAGWIIWNIRVAWVCQDSSIALYFAIAASFVSSGNSRLTSSSVGHGELIVFHRSADCRVSFTASLNATYVVKFSRIAWIVSNLQCWNIWAFGACRRRGTATMRNCMRRSTAWRGLHASTQRLAVCRRLRAFALDRSQMWLIIQWSRAISQFYWPTAN